MVKVSNVYRCRCLLALHGQDIHTHKQWVNGTPVQGCADPDHVGCRYHSFSSRTQLEIWDN